MDGVKVFIITCLLFTRPNVLLVTREWRFPSLFLTRGFVNRLRPSHYNQLSTPGPPRRSGPKCADASKISKWCICTTRWFLGVELMIIPGRDRCCQKVTRRQGNGLLQSARSEVGVELGVELGERGGDGGWSQKRMERDRERTIKTENTTLSVLMPPNTFSSCSLPEQWETLIKSDENVFKSFSYMPLKIFFLVLHRCTNMVAFRGESELTNDWRFFYLYFIIIIFFGMGCPQRLICNKHCQSTNGEMAFLSSV